MRSLFVTSVIVFILSFGMSANCAQEDKMQRPKVLLFTTIDTEYLLDTLFHWGNDVGIDGFILSYVVHWWSSKTEIFSNLEILKKINITGRQVGVDRNFLKVALGARELPLWTDDAAWDVVLNNFVNIADFIDATGTRGIVIDTEKYNVSSLYNPRSSRFLNFDQKFLREKIFQRGREIVLAVTRKNPKIDIILLQEGEYYSKINDWQEYSLWIELINGMLSVANNNGIVLGLEGTYSVLDELQMIRQVNQVLNGMNESVIDKKFWTEKCSIAVGMWPLGRTYSDKSSRYSSAQFSKQFYSAVALSSKYVWIYDQGTAWFQLSDKEVKKYTKDGRWIWEKEYQLMPTDRNIEEYYSVLKKYKSER